MNPIRIQGGGIAGLTAAYCLARSGMPVTVFEKERGIGVSRHGDFEGLENWIFNDSLNVFHSAGLDRTTLVEWPVSRFTVHCPPEVPFKIRSAEPFFSIVSRGPDPGTIDEWLYRSCAEKGVVFRFGESCPEGSEDVIACGSKKAAAFIRGGLFETELPDQVHLLLGDRFAPKGYAYLIIRNGLGTIAAAFKKQTKPRLEPFQESLDYFQSAGIPINLERYFGSRGSFSLPARNPFRRPIRIGEAGGFQDFLFGFGMKPAMVSALMAADYLIGDLSGAKKLNRKLKRKMRLSFVNRIIYEQLSDQLKSRLARKLVTAANPVNVLAQAYKWDVKRAFHWFRREHPLEIRFS